MQVQDYGLPTVLTTYPFRLRLLVLRARGTVPS